MQYVFPWDLVFSFFRVDVALPRELAAFKCGWKFFGELSRSLQLEESHRLRLSSRLQAGALHGGNNGVHVWVSPSFSNTLHWTFHCTLHSTFNWTLLCRYPRIYLLFLSVSSSTSQIYAIGSQYVASSARMSWLEGVTILPSENDNVISLVLLLAFLVDQYDLLLVFDVANETWVGFRGSLSLTMEKSCSDRNRCPTRGRTRCLIWSTACW